MKLIIENHPEHFILELKEKLEKEYKGINIRLVDNVDEFIEKLSHYVAEDDPKETYLNLVSLEEIGLGGDMADEHILMWEPFTFKYTVSELLDKIS